MVNPFFIPEEYEQLVFELDEIEEAESEERPDPTPETGYLTCNKCGDINPYEYPKKDFICRPCVKFAAWAKKK